MPYVKHLFKLMERHRREVYLLGKRGTRAKITGHLASETMVRLHNAEGCLSVLKLSDMLGVSYFVMTKVVDVLLRKERVYVARELRGDRLITPTERRDSE